MTNGVISKADSRGSRVVPKTVNNIVTVVKFVVLPRVDEEGDQIHPRAWNHDIQLPSVIKENQNRPTITQAEITELLTSLKERDAVLVALVAGTGQQFALRIVPDCQVLHVQRSLWHRREQAPKTLNPD